MSVCWLCNPPEAVAIHKAWKIFDFADIADKTATARTQHVHATVGSFSLAISMKTRYRIIFKGSPLARWVCTQISRYSRRNGAAESEGFVSVWARIQYTNTETPEIVRFIRYRQWKWTNRRTAGFLFHVIAMEKYKLLHVCISVCRSRSPPEAVAIHKAWKIFNFADIADKKATARTQHVHGNVGSFSLAISMKTRYTIIFKGSPLCPMGLYAKFTL